MKKLNLTDKRNPDYFYSEAIKTLRTNIQLSGQSIKTILVTSCYPNEGKSDIVLSLAQELGSIGKKVLLLDADIRMTACGRGSERSLTASERSGGTTGDYLFYKLSEYGYHIRRSKCTESVRTSQ